MENKKYINEEKYQKTKNKILLLALIVLIIGLLIGGGLIILGINKQKQIKNSVNENTRTESVVQSEIDDLNNQIADKEYECNSLDMMDSNWFADKTKCEGEVTALESKLSSLRTELWKIQSNYNNISTNIKLSKAIPFYMIGGFIILATLMISSSIFMFAKRREIMAFGASQVMPIGKEIIDDVAPTIGNAAGSIAKSIKDSLKDDDEK